MVHKIVLMGDPVLRKEATEVEEITDEVRKLVQDMFETMYHAEGVGLAAPQIGISKRIFVIDVRDEDQAGGRYALINPEIVGFSKDVEKSSEGCLSIPGLEEIVERPSAVQMKALDVDGNPIEIEGDELLGRALQHEFDHLNGILFLDRITPLKRKLAIKKWHKLQAED